MSTQRIITGCAHCGFMQVLGAQGKPGPGRRYSCRCHAVSQFGRCLDPEAALVAGWAPWWCPLRGDGLHLVLWTAPSEEG